MPLREDGPPAGLASGLGAHILNGVVLSGGGWASAELVEEQGEGRAGSSEGIEVALPCQIASDLCGVTAAGVLLAPLMQKLLGLTLGKFLGRFGRNQRLPEGILERVRVGQEPRLELLHGDAHDGFNGDALKRGIELTLPLIIPVRIDEDHGEVGLPGRIGPGQETAQGAGTMKVAATRELASVRSQRFFEVDEGCFEVTDLFQAPAYEQVRRAQFFLGEYGTGRALEVLGPCQLTGSFGVDDDAKHAYRPGTPPTLPESQMLPSDSRYSL